MTNSRQHAIPYSLTISIVVNSFRRAILRTGKEIAISIESNFSYLNLRLQDIRMLLLHPRQLYPLHQTRMILICPITLYSLDGFKYFPKSNSIIISICFQISVIGRYIIKNNGSLTTTIKHTYIFASNG